MNVFNRVVIILLILLGILIVIAVAAVPIRSFDAVGGFFRTLSASAGEYQSSHWPIFATAQVLVGGALVLIGLLFVWLELRRPRRRTIRAQKLQGGESHIAVESITQRLAYNIDQLPDVVSASPRVTGYGRGGMDLELVLETAPEIDVPMKTEEVLQVTKEVVQERMGLKLGRVQIKIKHAPYPQE